MPPQLHPDAEAILARLKKEGITALYHFTSVENLPYICREGALCSKQTLELRGKLSLIPGGNFLSHNLDRYRGNWGKVSLSLTPHTPMAYYRKVEQHLCFLFVRPEVATWSGVVFTDTNATSNEHQRGEGLTGLNYIKFEAVRALPFAIDNWRRFVQAEVLVPDSIPLTYVPEVAFVSQASLAHAERLCHPLSHPAFSVKNNVFSDSPRASYKTVRFPYVLEMILTDRNIDKNMLYFSHLNKNKYSKSQCQCITLAASVRVLAGTKARITIVPINAPITEEQVIAITEFATQNQYLHRHIISLERLPAGHYLLKYYLNDLCWASTNFEILE